MNVKVSYEAQCRAPINASLRPQGIVRLVSQRRLVETSGTIAIYSGGPIMQGKKRGPVADTGNPLQHHHSQESELLSSRNGLARDAGTEAAPCLPEQVRQTDQSTCARCASALRLDSAAGGVLSLDVYQWP
jgi:hypothetical protein